jgi:hypothetical protein
MNDPHHIHYWSSHYREERLAEASRQRLARRARASRRSRGSGGLGFFRTNPLALLRRAVFSE